MPQNTPMKRQFTTIDSRTVMSNLPQHWGGNDWTITGVDNPLPVGNYVQTESGVWIPQKGSDDGAADVRITGSIVELYHERGINITVTPGSSVVLVEGENFKDVKEIRGVLRWSFQRNNNWSLRIVYLRIPGSPMLTTKQQSIHFDSHEAIIESMPIVSTRWNIEVANMDSSDYIFQRGTLIGLR